MKSNGTPKAKEEVQLTHLNITLEISQALPATEQVEKLRQEMLSRCVMVANGLGGLSKNIRKFSISPQIVPWRVTLNFWFDSFTDAELKKLEEQYLTFAQKLDSLRKISNELK